MLLTFINEFNGFFKDGSFTREQQIKFWALFANAYYERIFEPINDFEELKSVYMNKQHEINNREAKMALYYFYKYRERQLVDILQEGLEARREQQKWFTLSPELLRYYNKVIDNDYAKSVLTTVTQKGGRCSARQYTILKLAVEGNLKPSSFGTKN